MLLVQDSDGRLRAVDWEDHEPRLARLLARHYGEGGFRLAPGSGRSPAVERMARYFDGDLHALDDVPVATAGTPFQRRVWRALRDIPVGTTISYGELARRVGNPSASRAVGLANGSNPVGVVVPCHRVIGANAKLTGYGGGLDRKRWLLEHEGAVLALERPRAAAAV